MSTQTPETIDAFSAELLKLAQNRELFRRVNQELIRSRIEKLKYWRAVLVDECLLPKLNTSLNQWVESRNLFIILAILERMQAEALEAAGLAPSAGEGEPEEVSDDEIDELDEGEESGGEEDLSKAQGNILRLRDLIGSYIGMDQIRGYMQVHPIIGFPYKLWEYISTKTEYYLFKVRRSVTTKKRFIDDFGFELAKRILSKPTNNPLILVALFVVWLALSLISIALAITLLVIRPGKIFELFGLDDEVLPWPE